MSQTRDDVIDLTEESNPTGPQSHHAAITSHVPTGASNLPPHSDRTIIDVDEQEDNTIDLREPSPEIQFLTSRPRSRSQSIGRHASRRRPGTASRARSPQHQSQSTVRVSATPRVLPQAPGRWTHALQNLHFPTTLHHNLARVRHEEDAAFDNNLNEFFQVPDQLNFLQAAFDYEQPSRPQPPLRTVSYEPPPPAKAGFTRSPAEDDILVCPHCNDELGTGEDEEKRQVWVIRSCGHVCPQYPIYRPS